MNATQTQNRPAPEKPLTAEECRQRYQKKYPKQKARGFQSIGEAIDGAYGEIGRPTPTARVPEPRWSTHHISRCMKWETTFFGSVAVEVQLHELGLKTEDGINCFAPVLFKGEPETLTFRFMHKLRDDVKLLQSQGSQMELEDVTHKEPRPLRVRVDWRNGVPHTRQTDKDNIDLTLLDKDGTFVQLQISLVSRNGKFWLVIQEAFAGQVVRTTALKADKLNLETMVVGSHIGLAAPLYAENAFPGCDFVATGGMVHDVIRFGIESGRSVTLSECKLARWPTMSRHIPINMMEKGWEPAVVLWMNAVIGWGFCLCEDGKSCFIHFANIIDEKGQSLSSKGEFPLLNPMRVIAIKFKEDGGRRKATAIRKLE